MRRRDLLTIATLCIFPAAVALVVSAAFFPHRSANSDESVYLLQADALRHGHLFPPAPEPATSFQPWLSAVDGDRYVTKYAPVHPGAIAAVQAVGLPPEAALAVIAAAAALGVHLLAREVLGDRRLALLAAGLFVASPLFLVQSGTFLPYLGNVALLSLFAAALLRSARTGRRRLAVVAGVLLGLAAFARPYDAVLFALPICGWQAWRWRRTPARWLPVVVGGAPVVLAMLAYFDAATGSPFELPFRVLDPADTIGFGERRIAPDAPYVDFDARLGAGALLTHVHLLAIWGFGGVLLVGFAAAAVATRAIRTPAAVALGLVGVVVPAGYLVFWGSAASLSWGAPFRMGPWYWMPVLVPLVVLGARGLAALHAREPRLAMGAVAFMVLFSVVVAGDAFRHAAEAADVDRRLWQAIEDADLTDALVFVPGPGLGNPLQEATNGVDLAHAPVVWAVDRSACENAAAARRFPDRRTYELDVPLWYRGLTDARFGPSILQPVEPVCAPWERDRFGTARAPSHSADARPARVLTPGADVPNPFVLVDGDRYVVYSSQTEFFRPRLEVRTGRSLDELGPPVEGLGRLPGWAVNGFTWAPDVQRIGDRYVLWFTAGLPELRPDGQAFIKCIGAAVASSPLGPFEPVSESPSICQRDRYGSIDPRAFVDVDGQRWLHWKSDDNADVAGVGRSTLFAQRLADDGVTLVGSPQAILRADQRWEDRIVEAPQMVRDDEGRYWLFYSGNWFNGPSYGLGVARCSGPAGPCRKPWATPWLASNAQGSGPGEASLFRDDRGWWIGYAPHHARDGGVRPLAVAPVTFGPDGPVLTDRQGFARR